MRVNGDELLCIFNFFNKQLAPRESIDVAALIIARVPGTYSATYSLVYGDKIEFGEKIFINFEV